METQPQVKVWYIAETAQQAAQLEDAIKAFSGTWYLNKLAERGDAPGVFVMGGSGGEGVIIRPYQCSIADVVIAGNSIREIHSVREVDEHGHNYAVINHRLSSAFVNQ